MIWRYGGVDPPWWWRPWLLLAERRDREAWAVHWARRFWWWRLRRDAAWALRRAMRKRPAGRYSYPPGRGASSASTSAGCQSWARWP